MLGRSVGLTDEQIAHLADDPLPDGVYSPSEAAIVRYAQASTRLRPITDELYGDLASHFDTKQIMELCEEIQAQTQWGEIAYRGMLIAIFAWQHFDLKEEETVRAPIWVQ